MTGVISIPAGALAAIVLATIMSVHAVLFVDMVRRDTLPAEPWQIIVVGGGWFWWARLLWLIVSG